MLIVTGIHGQNTSGLTAASRLSSRYGVLFSGAVQNREELPATTGSYFLQRTSSVLGKLLKLVHKA